MESEIEYSIGNIVNSFTEDGSILTNILLFVAIAVQAGIFEELLFRKAIIDYSKKNGKIFAVIISSIFFGLIHLNLSQFIFALLIGIVFGVIYVLSASSYCISRISKEGIRRKFQLSAAYASML